VRGFVQRRAGVLDDDAIVTAVHRVPRRRLYTDIGPHARHDERLHFKIAQYPVDIGGVERAVRRLVDHQLARPGGDLLQDAVAGRAQRARDAETERLFLQTIAPAEGGGEVAPVRQHGPQGQVNDPQAVGAEGIQQPPNVGDDRLLQAGEVVEGAIRVNGGKHLPQSVVGMCVHVLHVHDRERALRGDHREVWNRQPPGRQLRSPTSHRQSTLFLCRARSVLARGSQSRSPLTGTPSAEHVAPASGRPRLPAGRLMGAVHLHPLLGKHRVGDRRGDETQQRKIKSPLVLYGKHAVPPLPHLGAQRRREKQEGCCADSACACQDRSASPPAGECSEHATGKGHEDEGCEAVF
jgi:hypothetical protein